MNSQLTPAEAMIIDGLKAYMDIQSKLALQLKKEDEKENYCFIFFLSTLLALSIGGMVCCGSFFPALSFQERITALLGIMAVSLTLSFMLTSLYNKKDLTALGKELEGLIEQKKQLLSEFFEEKQLRATLQFLLDEQTPQKLGINKVRLEQAATQWFEASKSTEKQEQNQIMDEVAKNIVGPLDSEQTTKSIKEVKQFINPTAAETVANVSLQSSKYMAHS